jgi:hypothetical protein
VDTFTDMDTRMLLKLLHQYTQEFAPDLPQTVPALAEDLAMSLDETSDEDDRRRREIEIAYQP